MALIDCKFFSETLGMSSSMRVILPETTERRIGDSGVSRAGLPTFQGHPTLLLLHGLSDDESIWTRSTSIERYAAGLGLAVVMPNVHRSFYTNMVHGYRYWDFASREVLDKARAFFPLSHARADNFVAGLSMGGYGAFKLALSMPEAFSAAASLSGVADAAAFRDARALDFQLIFGSSGPERGSVAVDVGADGGPPFLELRHAGVERLAQLHELELAVLDRALVLPELVDVGLHRLQLLR